MPRPLALLLTFLLLHATGLAQHLPADSLTAPNGARPAAGAGSREGGTGRAGGELGQKPKTVYELVPELYRSFER